MHERLVENWLINVNEKTFQTPFCQILTAEGYTVLHLSRHGSFEEGKDILAIDPDGVPCAFQLKGSKGKISQTEWATYVDQINRLVEIPIAYPGIDKTKPYQAFFVTNGELEEEVRTEIDRRNVGWKSRGHPELQVITKGALLKRLLAIQKNFWPIDLREDRDLLELYLDSGSGVLQKSKFATFLSNLLENANANRSQERKRALVSASIFTSYALTPFENTKNIVALIEGWTAFLASVIGYAEKYKLPSQLWESIYHLTVMEIHKNLLDLCDELEKRKNFLSGNALVDSPFYQGRLTWLVGLMALMGIWANTANNICDDEQKIWLDGFVQEHMVGLNYWGDGAVPQILAVSWYKKIKGDELLADRLLDEMIRVILKANAEIDSKGIPDPYHSLQEVVTNTYGISDTLKREAFYGRSYILKGLIELLARHGWRGVIAELWPEITRMQFATFRPDSTADFCRLNNDDGNLIVQMPKMPQSWKELHDAATSVDDTYIPTAFKNDPVLLLLFVFVYPHRLTNDVMKLIDTWTDKSTVDE